MAEAFALLIVMNSVVIDARPINSAEVAKNDSLGQSSQAQPQNQVPNPWEQQSAQKLQMQPQAYRPDLSGTSAMAPGAHNGQSGAKVGQFQQPEQSSQKTTQQPSQVLAEDGTSRYGSRYGQGPQKLSQPPAYALNDQKYGAPTTATPVPSPPPPPSPSHEEIAAAEAAAKQAALIGNLQKDTDNVNTTLTDLMAGLQQDDDILDKTQKSSQSAADLLRDLKTGLSTGADLARLLDTLKTLVQTLQKIATNVVEQDDDASVHQLLLNLSSATHTLVLDFSSALPPSSDPSAPAPDMPDLTGLDSAVADKEEP